MGTKFAPPCACLSVGYLEESILFPRLLPLQFTLTECKLIEKILKSIMDDGFVLWPKNAKIDVFRELLKELHPSLKFTVEKEKSSCEQNFDTFVQVLNFLDVSEEEKVNERLSDLKTWLLSCSYPLTIIEKVFLTLNCRDLRLKKKR